MFGGYGLDSIGKSGYFNDLWKYNISIKQWAWVKGDSLPNGKGSYGTQGQTSIANNPGAGGSGISWTDNLGNLWFFRGQVWKYNPTNNEWTWVKGDSIPITSGNYGSLGIAAESNTPVGLTGSVSW